MAKLDNERARERRLLASLTELTTAGIKTAAQRNEFARIERELADVREDIRSLGAIEAHFQRNSVKPPVAAPAPVAPAVIRYTERQERQDREEQRAKLNKALAHMFRHGIQTHAIEQRDLESSSDSLGGALVPQTFQTDFAYSQKLIGPIGSLLTVVTQSSGTSPVCGRYHRHR
jgi:HK97 family phage major capsid protein